MRSSRPIINRDGNSLTKATWRRNELLDLKQVFGDLFFSYFILTNGSVLVEEKKTRLSLCGTHALKRAFTLDDSLFKVCSVRTLKRKRAFKFRWSNAFFCSRNGFPGPYFVYVCVRVNAFTFSDSEGKLTSGAVTDFLDTQFVGKHFTYKSLGPRILCLPFYLR